MSEYTLNIKGTDRRSGAGVASDAAGHPLLVPDALPGELVRATPMGEMGGIRTMRLVELVERSPERVEPPCRHYGDCGGCAMQLMRGDAYLDWKRNWIVGLLMLSRIETKINPVEPVGEGSRRRCVLGARRTRKTVQLGYRRRQSHDLVDITQCPILTPCITEQFDALRALMRPLLSRKGMARVTILAAENGLDLALDDVKPLETPEQRMQLVERTGSLPLARLLVNGEPVMEHAPPEIIVGDVPLNVPPKAFLQAVQSAQQAMIEKVLSLLPPQAGTVADLFCGLGTFTLPLAKRVKVLAVENDPVALAALKQALEQAAEHGLKPVTTLQRDLFDMPLTGGELRHVDAVIFDPPRAGAKAQAQALAASDVPCVIAVSCNPNSFMHDARVLIAGGYELKSVTPFDQFLYSPHLELIGHFEKNAAGSSAVRPPV